MHGRQEEWPRDAAGAVNFWTSAHASGAIRDLSDQQPVLRTVAGVSQPAGGVFVGAVGGEGVEQETAPRPGQAVPADDRHTVHLLPDLFVEPFPFLLLSCTSALIIIRFYLSEVVFREVIRLYRFSLRS